MFREKTGLKKLLLLQALIGGGSPAVERIALGNPLTFGTDLARPLVSLEIPFTPQQEGSGDPSPQNIRPIVPWNGLNVFHAGANLYKVDAISKTENGVTWTVNADGTISVDGVAEGYTDINLGRTAVPKKATLIMSGLAESENVVYSDFYFYDANENIVTILSGRGLKTDTVIDLSQYPTVAKIAVTVKRSSNVKTSGIIKPMLQVGTIASEFEPYQTPSVYPCSFPSPVYGGTLDVVSGVLTVQQVCIEKKWSEWESQSVGNTHTRKISNFDVPVKGASTYAWSRCNVAPQDWNTTQNTHFYIDENKAYVWLPNETDGDLVVQVAGVLVTPQEIQLTPAQITALIGDNTIWSDADGSMTCVYLVSSKYADEHPVGGLGFGFGSGSSDPDEPDDPENPDEPEEPIIDDSENNQTEGEEP